MNEVEYQNFVFPIEGVHDSVSDDQFHIDISRSDHVDSYFHSEQNEESNSSFYMHYENDFISPNLLMRRSDICGETDVNESFSLPQENDNKNKVYDRGKKF